MTHNRLCPINFGDCYECEWHDNSDGSCYYELEKEAIEKNKNKESD